MATVQTFSSDSSQDRLKLDALCVWIRAHLDEPLGWHALTAQSGLSHLELNRLFSVHLKITPMQWIRQQKDEAMQRDARAAQAPAASVLIAPRRI